MDSYNHYLIAKYSWQHPELFLDQWGKPLYNIIASPFAQLGLTGAVVFNILCLIGCSVLSYLISKDLDFQRPYLVYILVLFSPIFLDNIISSLTEPLCAFLVTWCIYLVSKDKLISGAILVGLLPYARSEGFIVLFVVGLYLILVKRRYRTIPFLLLGTFIFNCLGWLIEGDPFWVITQNPYISFELSGRNVCGSGGLSHYFYAGHYTFGTLTCVLIALAAPVLLFRLYLKQVGLTKFYKILLLLVTFGLYFGAHVFIWWQGMMGSCGYVRVMVVIAPIGALLAVYCFDFIVEKILGLFTKSSLIKNLITIGLILYAIYIPYRYYSYRYPLSISKEQEQYVKAADWLRQQNLETRRLIYLYPYLSVLTDSDPYDKEKHLDLWASTFAFTQNGDILIWDSHFGPNESNTPLERLEQDTSWVKIHKIIPDEQIITLNRADFEIHIFEKIK